MEKQTALESNAEYEAFVNKSGESSSGESSSGEMGTIKARIKID